ncbi:MAG: UbiX family flavin prenyltransferase [Chromatiales bacterium]|mgnify:FL=1|jgi:4-hydroxy-3-polyprenylbenzoate decarboxylase|nr:UbiX family flavin prenyltransferase [Chromatiales bacterium]MDH3932188.1 UbiX family flavin prenyltransferase [Chromatiales bacterium]MDH3946441.1 UbiX family flavin prenyltransferase [Chromatiales bacterium]MDH4013013.1 UbiX family flavin prenyltransferase [Chromatiales bacterium]PLX57043.1 MAG: 3-octaprenyl-4-hydroxybenzoate carboxy-lyase [Chromatiales bacterium]
MRLIIGMSGASGLIYGIRLLEILRDMPQVETHLVLSEAARLNITVETQYSVDDVRAMADEVYSIRNIAASISSGSFKVHGMVIAPCSMKTLSAVANSYADNLLVRAADVTLKERRRLVIMPRETPLHAGHCKLMYEASLMGAILFPPIPSFYDRPESIDDIVTASVARVLDLFDVDPGLLKRWTGQVGKRIDN